MTNFTDITESHIKSLDLVGRKKLGQYMTPQPIGKRMSEKLTYISSEEYRILDPAVGTGELLVALSKTSNADKISLHGWDIDKAMLEACQENNPQVIVRNRSIFDVIAEEDLNSFDKIIGNPPYFQISKKDINNHDGFNLETLKSAGRINIYGLFFEYCLKLLKDQGELILLVPPSMNNGAYFADIRRYILANSYIKEIEVLRENNLFANAITSAQIVHLVKTDYGYEKNIELSSRYVFNFDTVNKTSGHPTIFTEDSETITAAWVGKKSLHDSGYRVKTGAVEWNRHKTDLTDRPSDSSPLLYSRDITKDNELIMNKKLTSKRYMPHSVREPERSPSIIVNRIVGSLTNPKIRHSIVEMESYYTENHVNVITTVGENSLDKLKLLSKSLSETDLLTEYIRTLTGNTQLSSRELEFMIPI